MPSTVIRRFDYHPDARRLDVVFVSGRRYSYFEVPPETYAAMRASFAKGEFFNAHIRDRYRYERTDDSLTARAAGSRVSDDERGAGPGGG